MQSFLLSTVALKVRKAYLVVPAMAEAILVLPIPGGQVLKKVVWVSCVNLSNT